MGGPARPLHEPGNHRSSERCSHRHSADCGSLIERPTLLRITAPTPRPGARSPATAMVRLCAARIEDLGLGDFVKMECAACGHGAPIPPSALLQGLRLQPATLVLDLEPR